MTTYRRRVAVVRRAWRAVAVSGLALVLVSGGCGPVHDDEITVYAAVSLRDAFTEIAREFEETRSNTRVVLNFAGSQVLRAQIERGAPADVVATADDVQARQLEAAGLLAASPRTFVENALVLAVPADNPAGIAHLTDLAAPDVRVVMGIADVPVGRYARAALERYAAVNGRDGFVGAVLDNVVSFETNARLVAAKLELGVVDAGFVYRTDVLASDGALVEIALPPQAAIAAPYPIAVTKRGAGREAASAFVDFVHSPVGQRMLASHGFRPAG
ncbi:MAG: molybdate ABC transporter substrate-binding protein [Chloroflexi bacterium]|nr:molybdate ABC transporter substrate-binding protein [Chloroflexota bacterium]